jgi:hypothetical protein
MSSFASQSRRRPSLTPPSRIKQASQYAKPKQIGAFNLDKNQTVREVQAPTQTESLSDKQLEDIIREGK